MAEETPMSEELYSLEQVAELLHLHVRTVRAYVREGRLQATRIGKQYRVSREQLLALTGGKPPAPPPRRERHVDVNAVVTMSAVSVDDAQRMSTMLTAVARGGDPEGQPLHVQAVYHPER